MKNHKLATVVGSMNCMPTEYASILAERGYEVSHYYDADDQDSLSNPTIRWLNILPLNNLRLMKMKWFHPFTYLLPLLFHRKVLRDLQQSQVVFLSGFSISLARFAAIEPGVTVLALGYGDDLSVFLNPLWPKQRFLERSVLQKILFGWIVYFLHEKLVRLQRAGLRKCTHVAYFPPGFDPRTDDMLSDLFVPQDIERLVRYSINTKRLPILHPTRFREHRSSLKVIFPVRFGSSSDIFLDKGWRHFIEGVAEYFRRRPKSDALFICFNKGDVREAKAMAACLGIETHLHWVDTVVFDELYSMMNDCDVVVDQLGGQWLGVGMWGGLLGKVVMSNLESPAKKKYFENSHVLSANTPSAFADQLMLCESVAFRKFTAERSQRFAACAFDLHREFDGWKLAL